MKNIILRILISATLFALISGIIVLLIGLVLGWNTATQFSDGFFWAGAIIISLGFINALGMMSERTVSGLQYSQSAVHLDINDRARIWEADIFRGYKLLALLGVSGLLLFGLSGLALLFK